MNETALEVKSLTKKIGSTVIVNDVSFSVKKGEIFGLLGPNGAGKTTIIRMIASLINRTNGQVLINGHDLDRDFEGAMHDLGAIVENPEFYKYMTGRKNMIHYARMAKEKIKKERIDEVARLVKLDHAMDKKVKTYSLGMRQRLGVAQAVLHRPQLLILDEPTNGLDPQGIREFRDYLHQLANEGIGVLISSHLLSEMQLMCDRFAVIEKGKLIHIENNIIEEKEEDLREVVFSINNVLAAVNVIKEQFSSLNIVKQDKKMITLQATREDIAKVNRQLNEAEVDVYEINVVKKTLEDRFFEITEQEEVRV
ncbi:ABC transporter ATP-binding protein [Pradoshia sp. D12]|uniref:ABC transporter ATP-binding protein n=1 Tax=Bacillaceae TaxID=186817 RepID=UPI00112C3926|nr:MULTISPECIES: ABC transporter ATP-binding protein [Bacillaceae]QFK72851.1 ABC transporter ATP-binding protein [Pradoshia sp. D12]TPF71844.1 ABC transporter ATP-binding protein [Bacillus sp. D12]